MHAGTDDTCSVPIADDRVSVDGPMQAVVLEPQDVVCVVRYDDADDLERHSVVGSDSSYVSSVLSTCAIKFQLQADEFRFKSFVLMVIVFVHMYITSSCVAFFSSLYPVLNPALVEGVPRQSPIDGFLVTSQINAIDISSACFVLVGFFAAHTFSNVKSTDKVELCKIVYIYSAVDVFLTGIMCCVTGSVFHLVHKSFRIQDIFLTLIESVTCLRLFEFKQDWKHWHSLNPSSWPVMCLLFAFMLTPVTLAGNERLRNCHPSAGLVIPWINACSPIIIISMFALVRDDTNTFFINASNVGYRMLEFNLGICFYTSMQACPHSFWIFAKAVRLVCVWVVAAFVSIWWAQLGVHVHSDYGTCIRMYFFAPCIQTHHGFLMRGCFLGVTMICLLVTISDESMQKLIVFVRIKNETTWLSSALTAVVIVWLVCYAVHLLLEINFGLQMVHDNAALLVLLVPIITWALAVLWNTGFKFRMYLRIEPYVDSALCRCRVR